MRGHLGKQFLTYPTTKKPCFHHEFFTIRLSNRGFFFGSHPPQAPHPKKIHRLLIVNSAWIWRLGIARAATLAQCAFKIFALLGGVSYTYIPPTTTRYEVYERWGKPPPLPLLPPSASSASPMSSSAFFLSFSCVSLSLSSSPVAPLSFLFAKCFHIHISLLERLEDFPRRGGLPDKLQHARVAAEGEVQVAVAVVLADREPRRGEG